MYDEEDIDMEATPAKPEAPKDPKDKARRKRERKEGDEETFYDQGVEIQDVDPGKALGLFRQMIQQDDPEKKYNRQKEHAIYAMGQIFASQNKPDALKQLLVDIRPFFDMIPKAKTAKIVRTLLDYVGRTSADVDTQAQLCEEAIGWAEKEKRTFLKQRLQSKLADLYLKQQKYKDALAIINGVLREVKKFDDKLLLVEIELVESRVHLALQNLPKSKGALTAARSAANAVYCPPSLQAQIDLMAGILCGEEKDYKTAFSYFYEAFEGYNTMGETKMAVSCLKYMLLTKIMTNTAEDVYAIINGKAGVKYAGIEVEAMRAVADAHKKRSIEAFEETYKKYHAQLAEDAIIFAHLSELKNNLLEQNLIRLVEPFTRVQIPHVAKLIKLPLDIVESKLSEMILDKKLHGILDQGSGDLIVFDEVPSDKTMEAGLSTVKELGNVVDRLYARAQKLK